MIDIASFSADWLDQKKKHYGKDPGLMETMVHALYLLERLKISGLDFIFKGGTNLILLLDQSKRFSVDVDIVVSPSVSRPELEEYLAKINESSVFHGMQLDERRSYKPGIPKAHYKFFFTSVFSSRNKEGDVISNPEREILLDIHFSENHYPALVNLPIRTEWVIQKDDPIFVLMPDVNSIAGDKLTAFAPNTTGVPYGTDKEKEIVKQLFDVGCLFDSLTDLEIFKKSYIESVKAEISYRPERNIHSVQQVLQNTIDTSVLIAKKDILKGDVEKANFAEISNGLKQFISFVFVGKFGISEAQVAGSKAALLAAVVLIDYTGELQKFNPDIPLSEYLITHPDYNFLNKRLKYVSQGEALFYWHQTINLLYPENNK